MRRKRSKKKEGVVGFQLLASLTLWRSGSGIGIFFVGFLFTSQNRYLIPDKPESENRKLRTDN